jgi:hypothetical protein
MTRNRTRKGIIMITRSIPHSHAVAKWLAAISVLVFTTPSNAADGMLRPDDHAPAGIMYDHVHKAGEFMIGYRYIYDHSGSTMLKGTDEVSDSVLAAAGFSSAPDKMTMRMHMLDIMYAPTDWVTLMVMPMYMSMDMSMRDVAGATGGGHSGHGGGHTGPHSHGTSGFSDTILAALFRLHESDQDRLIFTAGMSAPTGSVSEKGSDGRFTHYMMQPSSGTWNALPSITYTSREGAFGWGTQLGAVYRFQQTNESGFRFGNRFHATAWASYSVTDWLSASLRGIYVSQGAIEGHYNGPHNHSSPPDLQGNYGGRFFDVGFGVNTVVPEGTLAGIRVGVEWLQPVSHNFNGFQQQRTGTFFFTMSKAL